MLVFIHAMPDLQIFAVTIMITQVCTPRFFSFMTHASYCCRQSLWRICIRRLSLVLHLATVSKYTHEPQGGILSWVDRLDSLLVCQVKGVPRSCAWNLVIAQALAVDPAKNGNIFWSLRYPACFHLYRLNGYLRKSLQPKIQFEEPFNATLAFLHSCLVFDPLRIIGYTPMMIIVGRPIWCINSPISRQTYSRLASSLPLCNLSTSDNSLTISITRHVFRFNGLLPQFVTRIGQSRIYI